MLLNNGYIKTILSGLSTKFKSIQAETASSMKSLQKTIDRNKKEAERNLNRIEFNLEERINSAADSIARDYGVPLLKPVWITHGSTKYPHIHTPFGLTEGYTFRVIFSDIVSYHVNYIYLDDKKYPLYAFPTISTPNGRDSFMGWQEPKRCYLMTYMNNACYAHFVKDVYTSQLITDSEFRSRYLIGGSSYLSKVSSKSSSEVFDDIMPSVTNADNGKLLGVLSGKWSIVDPQVIVASSTESSTKKFKITVDDSGTLSAVEVTE